MKLEIDAAFAAHSVVEFLGVLHPLWTRRALDELFAAGRVRSGGRPVGPKTLLGSLEELELVGDLEAIPRIWAPGIPTGVEVLHEDERLTVLSKPSGVPVVPDRDGGSESCLGFLLRRELEERVHKPAREYRRPRVVHRIDRLTSGLVIFARTLESERELGEAFESRRVRKDYRAIVLGRVRPARIWVDYPIAAGRKGRMRCDPNGRDATTAFDVLERFDEFSLVRASPRSGRTHQIRVHALAAGLPLAVDPLYRVGEYAARPMPPVIERLTLHARAYELPSSWAGTRRFECEPPEDFLGALRALRGPVEESGKTDR